MKSKFISKIVATVFIFLINLSAQDEIQFTHLTIEDGLSLNVVTQVLQDSRGFLWFGTYNGLSRFDGYNFKIFLPQPSVPNSLSDHSILKLYEDSKGYLWIGTNDGLNRYDYKTEKFTVYKNIPHDSSSISHNTISTIYEDNERNLWIGTVDGLDKYDRKKDNFSSIRKVSDEYNDRSQNSVSFIYEDRQNNIWLGVWNGLSCLKKDGKIVKYNLPGLYENNPASYYSISGIIEDNDKNLWIGTTITGLFQYNLITGKTKNYKYSQDDFNSISSNIINTIYIDRLNNLWIGTANGLNRFNREKNSFTRFQNDLLKPLSIVNNDVQSICEDKTGLIWLGTSGGVSKFYQTFNKFYYYKEDKINPEKGLSSSNVTTVFSDRKNNLWIGTTNGIDVINTAAGRIDRYRNNPENKNSLNNNEVKSILIDRSGIVWIGTNGGGLNRFDPATANYDFFRAHASDPGSLSNNGVVSLCEDYNGNLWVGTWWGLNFLDKKNGKFVKYFYDPNNPNTIRNNLIWNIYEDSKKMLWIGTDGGGVSCFNPQTNTFKNFLPDSSNVNNISSSKVVSICESRDGIMWFATTNGLCSYNRLTKKFKNYNIEDGLPSHIINGVIEDEKGFLWISTDKGLSKFNRNSGIFSNFTKRNGLKDIEFSLNVVSKSTDNILYFGGKYSLIYFNPDNISNELVSAPVVFTDLKIFNQSVHVSSDNSTILKESIITAKTIEIPSSNDIITLEFALLDYYNAKANTFKYKLSGFDNQWNDIGSKNNATYTNLPPGNYTFYVKAINNNDKRSEKEASLKIIIVPAYYQTWWFKIVTGIALLGATILFINTRTRKVKNQNKILEKRVTERTKIIEDRSKELENINIKLQNEIREKLLAEDTLKQYNSRLEAYHKIYRGIISAKTVDEIIREILIQMPMLFNFIDTAAVSLFDFKSDLVIVNSAHFSSNPDISFSTFKTPLNYDDLKDKTYRLNSVYYINDIRLVQNKLPIDEQILSLGFHSYLAAPLFLDNNRIGSLSVGAKKTDLFSDEHKEVLLDITNQLAVALHQAQLQAKIEEHSQSLQSSLSEKEVLLKEVHHRVKNNLQVISSLLYLNSRKTKDKEVLDMFKDSQNSVKSIALVHERLYQSKDLGRIDFKDYVQRLTNDLLRSYAVNPAVVSLDININNIFIDISTAVPCGLIINELISNSLKYAFPDYEEKNKKGLIKIDFSRNGNNELILVLSDNGIGIPGGIDEKKKNSLGLQLIETLVTQLEGTLELDLSSGTCFKIKFKNLNQNKDAFINK